jgi:hypothetical protein
MTSQNFYRRGDVLRTVISTADDRRDGLLPMEVDGVAQTFRDELTLLGALQLRWHTRLSGHVERALMEQPMDLESAVVRAWRATASEMPGVRLVLDHYRAEPTDDAMAQAMAKATAKEHTLLAVMAGLVSQQDASAARVGARLEDEARSGWRPAPVSHRGEAVSLVGRIRAALAA